jgi:hypothetical protein
LRAAQSVLESGGSSGEGEELPENAFGNGLRVCGWGCLGKDDQVKAAIREMMERAERGEPINCPTPVRRKRNKGGALSEQPTAPIVLNDKERFLVAHMLRHSLKECTNPLAIALLKSALAKLDEGLSR